MKQSLALILAVVLTLSLAACGGDGTGSNTTPGDGKEDRTSTPGGEENNTAIESNEHTHTVEVLPAVEATCTKSGLTEGKTCSECGEVIVEQEMVPALGHTTNTGTCERCGQSFGIWEMYYYVDEFNEPTEDWYIVNNDPVTGTFSNSATTNSDLALLVTYDYQNRIAFILYEYGKYQVKNVWDTEAYRIVMRTPDGTDHEMKGYIYENGDRLVLDDSYVDDVISALTGDGEISFYMQSERHETTRYLFTISASNFADKYNSVT